MSQFNQLPPQAATSSSLEQSTANMAFTTNTDSFERLALWNPQGESDQLTSDSNQPGISSLETKPPLEPTHMHAIQKTQQVQNFQEASPETRKFSPPRPPTETHSAIMQSAAPPVNFDAHNSQREGTSDQGQLGDISTRHPICSIQQNPLNGEKPKIIPQLPQEGPLMAGNSEQVQAIYKEKSEGNFIGVSKESGINPQLKQKLQSRDCDLSKSRKSTYQQTKQTSQSKPSQLGHKTKVHLNLLQVAYLNKEITRALSKQTKISKIFLFSQDDALQIKKGQDEEVRRKTQGSTVVRKRNTSWLAPDSQILPKRQSKQLTKGYPNIYSTNDGDIEVDRKAPRPQPHNPPHLLPQTMHQVPVQDMAINTKPFSFFEEGKVLLNALQMHPSSGPFLYPLDKRMDLTTVSDRLGSGVYTCSYELAVDIRRIWSDSYATNQNNSQVYTMTVTMSQYFEKLFKEFQLREETTNSNLLKSRMSDISSKLLMMKQQSRKSIEPPLLPQNSQRSYHGDVSPMNNFVSIPKTSGSTMSVNSKKKKNSYKPLSERDQKKLEEDIQKLTQDQKREVIDMLRDTINVVPNSNGSLLFDIGKLPARKQRELKQLVTGYTDQTNNGSSNGSLVGQIRPAPSTTAPPVGAPPPLTTSSSSVQQKTLKILEKLKRKKEKKLKSASVKSGSVANMVIQQPKAKVAKMFADSSESQLESGDEGGKKKKNKKQEDLTPITPGGDLLSLYQSFKQQKSSTAE